MSNKPIDTVDYLFLGLGAANCLFILNMYKLGLLSNKSIAIIEPNKNNLNERNFCFWCTEAELMELNIENLVGSKWKYIKVAGCDTQAISPLNYFHIKGIDLYSKAKEILLEQKVNFYTEAYTHEPYIEAESFVITLNDTTIFADKVFDSRPPHYKITDQNQSHLLQTFYGWTLKTENYSFDHSTMVMMDFDIPQDNFCQFMYVLPFTENTALFEVTRFGKEKISQDEAEKILEEYLSKRGFSYQIIEEEKGVIPMSSATITNNNYGSKWIYTGASANMIKPTTGYAFHNMAIDAKKNSESMLSQQPFKRRESHGRFKFYDGLLLKILEEKPQLGKQIFQDLFKHTPINNVLKFLNEKSSLKQELFMFAKLPLFTFLSAAFKDITYRISKISAPVLALVITIMMLILSAFGYEKVLYVFLAIGFFTIGLSHGAVDHITNEAHKGLKQLLKFSIKYIIKGAFLGLVWLVLPDLALVIFLVFSAWHFGQADFKEWNLNNRMSSFLWGSILLSIILFFHLEATTLVLENINGLTIHQHFVGLAANQLLILKISIIFCSILLVVFHKSKQMFLTVCYLLLTSNLPLIISFGVYFVLQHSLHGWRHLKVALKITSYNLWLQSLPFSIGGAIVISTFMLTDSAAYMSLFFILLSCLSVPHIMLMDNFYFRFKAIKN